MTHSDERASGNGGPFVVYGRRSSCVRGARGRVLATGDLREELEGGVSGLGETQ